MPKKLVVLLTSFLLLSSTSFAAWTIGGLEYTKRKKITIDNAQVDSTLTDFPVLVKWTNDTDIGPVSNNDGFDHRYTTSDGSTLCKYEREVYRPYSADTLLLHFDGADGATSTVCNGATDRVITFVGTAQIDTAQKKFGDSSLLLDGNSDYISLPDSDDWNFGTGSLTIDFQFRLSSLPLSGEVKPFFSQRVDNNNVHLAYLYNNGGSTYEIYWDVWSGGSNIIRASSGFGTTATDTWYHLALIRNGNSFMIFKDGTQIGSTVTDTDSIPDYAAPLRIGEYNAQYFPGWIDEFRVLKGTAAWTSDFTAPTTQYANTSSDAIYWVKVPSISTSADTDIYIYMRTDDTADGADAANVWDDYYKMVYHFGNGSTLSLNDSTGSYNLTNSNLTASSTAQVYGAMRKTTGTEYATKNTGSDLTNCSVSCWYRPQSTGIQHRIIESATSAWMGWFFENYHNAMIFGLYNGAYKYKIDGASLNSTTTWYHIGVTYNGEAASSAVATFYLNGASSSSGTLTGGSLALPTGSSDVHLGRLMYNSTLYYEGNYFLDELRVSDTVRSAEWVAFEYANMSSADNELTFGAEEEYTAPATSTGNFFTVM